MLEWLKTLDAAVLLRINHSNHPLLNEIMWILSMSWHTYLLVILCAVAIYRRYRLKRAVEFLVGCAMVVACADITANIAKHSVKRYRPTHHAELGPQLNVVNEYRGGKYGFFSAHAANSWAIVTFLFLSMKFINRRLRLLLFLYPPLIMYSRMYLGVHYPSDVLTGMVCGIIYGWLGFLVLNAFFFKKHETSS